MPKHKQKLLSDFTKEEYLEFKKQGLKHDDVCEKLYVSRDTLQVWVRENGLTGVVPKYKYDEATRKRMVDLYKAGMRICDVAREIGCSEHAVRCQIKKEKEHA